jgi:hypothetical protein
MLNISVEEGAGAAFRYGSGSTKICCSGSAILVYCHVKPIALKLIFNELTDGFSKCYIANA